MRRFLVDPWRIALFLCDSLNLEHLVYFETLRQFILSVCSEIAPSEKIHPLIRLLRTASVLVLHMIDAAFSQDSFSHSSIWGAIILLNLLCPHLYDLLSTVPFQSIFDMTTSMIYFFGLKNLFYNLCRTYVCIPFYQIVLEICYLSHIYKYLLICCCISNECEFPV